MSFDWNEFLLLAKCLNGDYITQDLTQAKFRTAISRVYYACYNIAKTYLETYCNVDFESKQLIDIKKSQEVQNHGIIPKIMMTSDNADIKVYGGRLETLRGKRIHADYKEIRIENIQRKVNDSVKIANEFISTLDLFKTGKATINLSLFSKFL